MKHYIQILAILFLISSCKVHKDLTKTETKTETTTEAVTTTTATETFTTQVTVPESSVEVIGNPEELETGITAENNDVTGTVIKDRVTGKIKLLVKRKEQNVGLPGERKIISEKKEKAHTEQEFKQKLREVEKDSGFNWNWLWLLLVIAVVVFMVRRK